MPRKEVDGKIIITYNHVAREKYWGALSTYLIENHGKEEFTNHGKVEEILVDAFGFLVQNFKDLISTEKSYSFFLYVFWLHEQSIQLHFKTLDGFIIPEIPESEFARYRRILKLILEQGCDVDFEWGQFPNGNQILMMDEKIQNLLYLGTWIYEFADFIAYHKMIEECHFVYFEDDILNVDYQYHYGQTYKKLIPEINEDYTQATFDENAIYELRKKIEECFGIDYDFAGGIIFEIKKHHSVHSPDLQTIEPAVLPLNLARQYGIPKVVAEDFYAGLSISRHNKLTIAQAILKPYSTQRYMFRPILIYRIGGENRALVGKEKFAESIMVLATNALHWNAMLEEWRKLKCMQSFMSKKGDEHDKILENEIEEILKGKDLFYARNIKSFKQYSKINVRIDNEIAGEIDLIVVNQKLKTILVADAKYNRARYEAVGYRADYSNFTKTYESQLKKKVKWVTENLEILKEHLQIIYNKNLGDISGYKIEGIFIINTPTFYMFNGEYKAITLRKFPEYVDGTYDYPNFMVVQDDMTILVRHPYFRKPIFSATPQTPDGSSDIFHPNKKGNYIFKNRP